jgi:Mechanosensitive ion channel, conserved TM helix
MWKEVLDDVIRKTLADLGERVEAFAPNILAMLLILLMGLVAAFAVRVLIRLVLPRVGFDRFAQRVGLSVVLQKGGITRQPSRVLAAATAWAVLGVFVLLAIGALNLQFATDLVSRGFIHLPQLLIAGALLVLGGLISGFVRRSVLIAAVNAGLPSARLLAGIAHSGILILFVAMALEQLGVGRQIILLSFAILFGGVVFALSLAFGLAGRDLAREFLERMLRRPEKSEDELRHL